MPPIGSLLGWLDDKNIDCWYIVFHFDQEHDQILKHVVPKHTIFRVIILQDMFHVLVNNGKDIASRKYCIGIAGIDIALWTYETSKWMT